MLGRVFCCEGQELRRPFKTAEQRANRGHLRRVRDLGRFQYRRQLEDAGKSSGEVREKIIAFNQATLSLPYNDLYFHIRQLLCGRLIRKFVKEVKFVVLGQQSNSSSSERSRSGSEQPAESSSVLDHGSA